MWQRTEHRFARFLPVEKGDNHIQGGKMKEKSKGAKENKKAAQKSLKEKRKLKKEKKNK